MTMPAPGIVTGSFAGTLTPAQVWALLNALVEGSPFAASLTRANTSTGKMAFPTVGTHRLRLAGGASGSPQSPAQRQGPDRGGRQGRGLLPVSSGDAVGRGGQHHDLGDRCALADCLSRDLDLGLLRGTGTPQPNGIIAQADEVSGPTLIAAAGAAIAAIGEAGGTTSTIAMSPTVYAAELTRHRRPDGRLVHPDGLPDLIGLDIVQVPGLDPPLVYDAGRCYLVLGQDSNVTLHDDPHHDAMLLLVKARANVGVPVKDKAIRKLDITEPGRAARPAAKTR